MMTGEDFHDHEDREDFQHHDDHNQDDHDHGFQHHDHKIPFDIFPFEANEEFNYQTMSRSLLVTLQRAYMLID